MVITGVSEFVHIRNASSLSLSLSLSAPPPKARLPPPPSFSPKLPSFFFFLCVMLLSLSWSSSCAFLFQLENRKYPILFFKRIRFYFLELGPKKQLTIQK